MEYFKNWLEILYFLSGPVIAVLAWLALAQIKLAKEQILEQRRALSISSKRDALKLTADQVTRYADKIIPLLNILDKKIKDEGMEVLDKFEVEITDKSIKLIPPKEQVELKDFLCLSKEFSDAANALESFCTYFSSGVADEKIAYLTLGSTFCNSVKKMLPILIPSSDDGKSFSSILFVYMIWAARIENEVLSNQKKEIEKKLNSSKEIKVSVIGTE